MVRCKSRTRDAHSNTPFEHEGGEKRRRGETRGWEGGEGGRREGGGGRRERRRERSRRCDSASTSLAQQSARAGQTHAGKDARQCPGRRAKAPSSLRQGGAQCRRHGSRVRASGPRRQGRRGHDRRTRIRIRVREARGNGGRHPRAWGAGSPRAGQRGRGRRYRLWSPLDRRCAPPGRVGEGRLHCSWRRRTWDSSRKPGWSRWRTCKNCSNHGLGRRP